MRRRSPSSACSLRGRRRPGGRGTGGGSGSDGPPSRGVAASRPRRQRRSRARRPPSRRGVALARPPPRRRGAGGGRERRAEAAWPDSQGEGASRPPRRARRSRGPGRAPRPLAEPAPSRGCRGGNLAAVPRGSHQDPVAFADAERPARGPAFVRRCPGRRVTRPRRRCSSSGCACGPGLAVRSPGTRSHPRAARRRSARR